MSSLVETVNSQSFLINHLRLPGGIGEATSKAGFHWISWKTKA
jgi:hypothetical protein